MNYPEMKVVSSSNIAELGYDQESQTVYVRFLNGSLYIYKGVPEYEFESKTILIAEDNLSNIEVLQGYLKKYPFKIYIAKNGLDAVDCANKYCPDIILMDMDMVLP